MKLIKLDAIDSTNEFLKGLSNNQILENFTVVTAESQTHGKGQMGATWLSEPSKNLVMSVLVKNFVTDSSQIFDVNRLVAVSIIRALEDFSIPELSIKWPNDIMSSDKKIGGILIENSIKSNGTIISIVGLGLNVNQTCFQNLPKASSLSLICKTTFNTDELLARIIKKLEQNFENWNQNFHLIQSEYTNRLFKKGIPMAFSAANQQNFMGIIQGVSPIGKLELLLENGILKVFDIKEIEMLYL